jgi:starch synthase
MYAMKYGNAPIARATGGLRDTISEFDAASCSGNGFLFEEYEPEALLAAAARAVRIFRNPSLWRRLMSNCFQADFSWSDTARQYLDWFGGVKRESSSAQPPR